MRRVHPITDVRGAAQSWIVGALPPPEDVELNVVCPVFGMREREAHFNYAGAHWHCFRLKRFEPLFLRRRFTRQIRPFVRELKPDVVHGWGGEVGNGLVATWLSKQAIVSVQGLLKMLKKGVDEWGLVNSNDEHGFAYWLRCQTEKMTYRRAKVCLCESRVARDWLKRCYGVGGEVVPQPLRSEFLEPRKNAGAEKSGTTKFLFVGQDVPRKGIEDLRVVARRHPELNITYVTGGKSAAEIAELMRTHDVFVLPSYGDTGPTAIKEALAMGMPVIAYDNTGPKELLEKYGGTLVKTGDVEALAAAMMTAMRERGSGDVDESSRKIRHELSRDVVWEKLLAVYGRVKR